MYLFVFFLIFVHVCSVSIYLTCKRMPNNHLRATVLANLKKFKQAGDQHANPSCWCCAGAGRQVYRSLQSIIKDQTCDSKAEAEDLLEQWRSETEAGIRPKGRPWTLASRTCRVWRRDCLQIRGHRVLEGVVVRPGTDDDKAVKEVVTNREYSWYE